MKLLNLLLYLNFYFFLFNSNNTFSQQITWLNTNGPVGEVIKTFSVVQNDIIFCGTASNGIYKSTDLGMSWTNSSSGLSAFDVNSIHISQSGLVFTGLNGGGIAKSTNSGENWIQTSIELTTITSIAENISGDLFASGWGVIYRSSDDGLTWDTLTNGLPQADWIKSIVISSSQSIFCVSGINGVFYSNDNGQNFSPLGLEGIELNYIVKNSDDFLFAASNGSGIYKSTDNGSTWTPANDGLNDLHINTLWCDSNNNLFAGLKNGKVYLSINNGQIWQPLNTTNSLSEINSIVSDDSDNIFAGTSLNGVFCASEGNYKWLQCNNGFKYSEVINLLAVDSTQVLAASSINGIFRTADKGNNWMNNSLQGNIGLTLARSKNRTIYAGLFAEIGFFGDKLRSDDNGYFWVSIGTGLPIEPAYDFAFSNSNDVYTAIAGSSAEIYYSSNSGNDWTKISNSIADPVFSIAINSAGTIFAGSTSGVVYRLVNGGLSWTALNLNSPQIDVTKIAINNKDFIFAASNSGGGIFRSTDNGSNWENISFGLLDTLINSILIDPNDLIFIATNSQGVYVSKDNGDSWTPTSSLIPLPNVTSLAMDDEGYLYAGTRFNGVYRTFQTLTNIDNEMLTFPAAFSLEQNFPNPFNPATTIQYSISKRTFVNLKVYDVLGNEIAQLVNSEKTPGVYKINFDASDLSSGIYFYKLTAENFTQSRKMLLIK